MSQRDLIIEIMDEMKECVQKGYLSAEQHSILMVRKIAKLTYDNLIAKFGSSGRTALTHCLLRTCKLEFWKAGMKGKGTNYLCEYDRDTFIKLINSAADEQNCITAMYAVSLAYYLKKKKEMIEHLHF